MNSKIWERECECYLFNEFLGGGGGGGYTGYEVAINAERNNTLWRGLCNFLQCLLPSFPREKLKKIVI